MKKILFVIFVITTFNLGAQDYEYAPFATEDAQWSVSDEKYALHGDTVINGMKYSKVYRQEEREAFEFDINKAEYFCAIRNDIENKRVYGVYKDDLPVKYHENIQYARSEGKEFLLYDFSLNMGDTVSVANFAEADKDGYIRYVKFERVDVIGIDITNKDFLTLNDNDSIVTLENGMKRRRILMANDVENIWQCWTEGIGSSDGPFRHYNQFEHESASIKRLLCYNEDNEYLYYQDEFDIDGENDCFLSKYYTVDVRENKTDNLSIYPNPTNGIVNIENLSNTGYHVSIYNTKGQKLISESATGKTCIDMSNMQHGLYILNINDGENNSNYKLIKNF